MTASEQLRGAAVLVLGDVMLDEYLWGDVSRISPEAPVPVVAVKDRTHVAGGAANVAVGVTALEGRALIGGLVGDDPSAAHLREQLEPAGVETDGLHADGRRTTVKTRVIAQAQQMLRTDVEDGHPVGEAAAQALLGWLRDHVGGVDSVVLSDYGKGVVTPELAEQAIAIAREAGKPVVVDSKAHGYEHYRGATVLTPNQHDASRASGLPIRDEDDLHRAVARLRELVGDDTALLVTRGAAGMTLFATGEPFHVPAEARDVYDVTGAGDTVVAVLAIALGRGLDLQEAVRIANSAAGVVVGKLGTSTVTLGELDAALRR